jgi:hypothetical protein
LVFRIDLRSLNDYLDLAAELLADDTVPEYERGVFEMTAWTIGLDLSDPNDRGYLAVRLHLDLDRMYPPDGRDGILLTRDQLESWADGPITDDEIVALSDAIPNSSVPSAIDTIVNEALR